LGREASRNAQEPSISTGDARQASACGRRRQPARGRHSVSVALDALQWLALQHSATRTDAGRATQARVITQRWEALFA